MVGLALVGCGGRTEDGQSFAGAGATGGSDVPGEITAECLEQSLDVAQYVAGHLGCRTAADCDWTQDLTCQQLLVPYGCTQSFVFGKTSFSSAEYRDLATAESDCVFERDYACVGGCMDAPLGLVADCVGGQCTVFRSPSYGGDCGACGVVNGRVYDAFKRCLGPQQPVGCLCAPETQGERFCAINALTRERVVADGDLSTRDGWLGCPASVSKTLLGAPTCSD